MFTKVLILISFTISLNLETKIAFAGQIIDINALFKSQNSDLAQLKFNGNSMQRVFNIFFKNVFVHDPIEFFTLVMLYRIHYQDDHYFNQTHIIIFGEETYIDLILDKQSKQITTCIGTRSGCAMGGGTEANAFDGKYHKITVTFFKGTVKIFFDCVYQKEFAQFPVSLLRGSKNYEIQVKTSQQNVRLEIKKLEIHSGLISDFSVHCLDIPKQIEIPAPKTTTFNKIASPTTNKASNNLMASKVSMIPMGPKGSIGPVGPQGPIGPVGPKGSIGPMGPQGPKGTTGDKGVSGKIGSVGLKGNRGVQGEKGDIGLPGEQGLRGITGLKGDKGESVSVSILDRINEVELKKIIWDTIRDFFTSTLKESEILFENARFLSKEDYN